MQDHLTNPIPKEQARLIDAQISLLQLASELKNIRKACKVAGVARSSFYEIKKAYEQFGRNGLLDNSRGPKPKEISPEIEAKVLEFTREYPSYSYKRILDTMVLNSHCVGETTIKRVWQKHQLNTKMDRFLWLDREALEGRGIMTEGMLKEIERLKTYNIAKEQHIDVKRPGELISQDLYMVGVIKGVGRIYLQSAVDCYSSYGFAKLVPTKTAIHSVALVHEKIIPFYDSLKIKIQAILTDQGREYHGRPDQHDYEIYLGAQDIEHRLTKVKSPWTNGFVERFHRTLKDEFFAKRFREKLYSSVDELQKDLDIFIQNYNETRAHQGYRNNGSTPLKTIQNFIEMENQNLLNTVH